MKNTLKITVPVAVLTLIATPLPLSTPAFADDSPNTANVASSSSNATLQVLIGRGDLIITQQLSSLNRLSTQVSANSRLSSADQTAFVNQLNGQITALNTQKAKLDAETDPAAAQADITALQTSNQVGSFIVPQISMVSSINAQQAALANLATTLGTLQGQVNTAKNAGRSVTQLQAWLDDAATSIQAAQNQFSTTGASVLALQPSDFTSNRGVLGNYQDQLLPARANYLRAQADIRAAQSGLFWSTLWF